MAAGARCVSWAMFPMCCSSRAEAPMEFCSDHQHYRQQRSIFKNRLSLKPKAGSDVLHLLKRINPLHIKLQGEPHADKLVQFQHSFLLHQTLWFALFQFSWLEALTPKPVNSHWVLEMPPPLSHDLMSLMNSSVKRINHFSVTLGFGFFIMTHSKNPSCSPRDSQPPNPSS